MKVDGSNEICQTNLTPPPLPLIVTPFSQVIFRSCKLIPTMAIAVLWRKKYVSRWEFLAATAMCAGLVIFAKAESEVEPDFDPMGIILVLLSVCADAFLPNAQVTQIYKCPL